MNKFYFTSVIPYVNAAPHIGHAQEFVYSDVIKRYKQLSGFAVKYLCGADENGLKIIKAATAKNMEPQKFTDINQQKFLDLAGKLQIKFDYWQRGTNINHQKSSQELWRLCNKNGDIYKKNYSVKYCVGCELEKTDSELENGKCPVHPNQEIELIEEENYFFKYSSYQKPLLDFYKKNPDFVVPASRLNEITEFTKKGLEDFSISRLKEKMPWGVEVPGDEKHVMYVWFDALVGYISALGWPDNGNFESFWPGMQVAGKDNLRQQSSMWQAMLLSAGLPNSTQIFIHGFITVGGQKMSKSLGNVIDPFELVKKYGVDAVRYYLLREITPTEDGDFTIEKFQQRYNADLAGGIGNLLARTVVMANKLNSKSETLNSKQIQKETEKTKKDVEKYLEEFKFNDSLKSIWELISFCDKYINEEKPWEGKENAPQVVSDVLFALSEISDLLLPFLPETSQKIKTAVETKTSEILFPRLESSPSGMVKT